MTLTLAERVENYNTTFPKFAKQAPLMATDRWVYGVWIIGNNYQRAMDYYGAFPPTYLKRVYSLFPDVGNDQILHLFSGSLGDDERGDRFDINPETHPTICGDAEHLSRFVKHPYRLIVADPPYSGMDAEHYGTAMISRNKVLKECLEWNVLEDGGYIVWLDQVLPMYRKTETQLIGTVGYIEYNIDSAELKNVESVGMIEVIGSTNHRVRCAFIFEKLPTTEIFYGQLGD